MTVEEVLHAAAASRFGDLTGPPVDVEAIAEELCGLRLVEADLADGLSGLLLAGEQRVYYSAREAARSAGRYRFTVAHELGHWYLHHAPGAAEDRYCRSAEVGITVTSTHAHEREANRFAGELLMPAPLLRAAAARLNVNVGLLARDFGVSEPAMKVRLNQLGLLPAYMQ